MIQDGAGPPDTVVPVTATVINNSKLESFSTTSTLVFKDSLYPPLITVPKCLFKTARSNSELASSQYVQGRPYLHRPMQSQNSVCSESLMERARANFHAWQQELER